MKPDETKASDEPPLICWGMPQTHRGHLIYPGKALCPFCRGAGLEPSAATTFARYCAYCEGAGVVRCPAEIGKAL